MLALVVGLGAFTPLSGAGGAPLPVPQSLYIDPVGAFSYPTYLTAPPGDQQRLFVVQKEGQIKLVLNGVL